MDIQTGRRMDGWTERVSERMNESACNRIGFGCVCGPI